MVIVFVQVVAWLFSWLYLLLDLFAYWLKVLRCVVLFLSCCFWIKFGGLYWLDFVLFVVFCVADILLVFGRLFAVSCLFVVCLRCLLMLLFGLIELIARFVVRLFWIILIVLWYFWFFVCSFGCGFVMFTEYSSLNACFEFVGGWLVCLIVVVDD